MSLTHSIIWDGHFIQEVPNAFAQAEQAAGRAQIFEGPAGYQPYFTMLPLSAFPFSYSFSPLDLIRPGDLAGLYNPNDINSLFQTSAGPVVPVTGDGDIVQFIVDENGQFNLSRTAAGDSAVYEGGLLAFDPARANGRMSIRSGNLSSLDKVTIVCGACVNFAEGSPSNNNTLISLAIMNALGTVGITLGLTQRTDGLIRPQLWSGASGFVQPPDQPAPPSNQPFCLGARFDSSFTEQQLILNDDTWDLTSGYSAPGSATFRIQSFMLAGQTTPFTGLGPTFFINRWLSDYELRQLKTWMLENTPTP
jgi:hypothetical protein